MSTNDIFLFIKFGHCKFRDNCRYRHINLLCDEVECDIINCSRRHPKMCRNFGNNFRPCKFKEHCSFRHVSLSAANQVILEVPTMNDKIQYLDKLINEKDEQIEALEHRITLMEDNYEKLKIESQDVVDSFKRLIDTAVSKAVEAVITTLNSDQKEKEIQNQLRFNALTDQLAALVHVISPPKSLANNSLSETSTRRMNF